jgi:Plasmid pRiA4b ORF-3-like protein
MPEENRYTIRITPCLGSGETTGCAPATAGNKEATVAKKAVSKKAAESDVLSLKVTLRHTKPPIWRRILMPCTMTLADLHLAIQKVMDWDDDHLHNFEIGQMEYSDPAMVPEAADEARVTLSSLVTAGKTRFLYTYDFGDDWKHDIQIEKALPTTATAKAYPACVAGARNSPPEDCGGVWGYEELLAVLADPDHLDREERLEWLGEDFDPAAFSVAEADAALAAVFQRTEPSPAEG